MFTTILKEDLAFWGIDELSLQACCSLKYYSQISSCQSELEEERNKRYGFQFYRYKIFHFTHKKYLREAVRIIYYSR